MGQWPIRKLLSQPLLKINEKIGTQITYLKESGNNQLMWKQCLLIIQNKKYEHLSSYLFLNIQSLACEIISLKRVYN